MLTLPDSPAFLNASAVLLAAEGSHKEAIACFFQGLRLDPQNPVLCFNLAMRYRAVGELEGAKTALGHAVAADATDSDTLDTLGVVFHESGQDAPAETCFRMALELDPCNGQAWNNFGVLAFSQKKYREAARAFETAVSFLPAGDSTDALINLRDTYGEIGETEKEARCAAMLKTMGVDQT